jgi:hypothetical protein
MKKQINDLLLKMQNGENCIGETANELLNLYNVSFSLRDRFAAEAMQSMIIKGGIPSDYHWGNGQSDKKPELAKRAYGMADAMIKARSNES